jgi:hypothetical protein
MKVLYTHFFNCRGMSELFDNYIFTCDFSCIVEQPFLSIKLSFKGQHIMRYLASMILLILFTALLIAGTDPYDNIRRELGLDQESNEQTQDNSIKKSTEKGKRKKWKAPPGYHTASAQKERDLKRVLKDNPHFTEEEALKIANQIASGRWKPSKGYFKKEAYVERKKREFSNADPTLSSEKILMKANEAHEKYILHQREKQSERLDSLKKAKKYMESIDKDLAKNIKVYGSNTKESWIKRRMRGLQKKNLDIKESDAYNNARMQYNQKIAKEYSARKKRKAELAKNKHENQ